MKSITQQLADFAVEQKYEHLPKEVVHESKRILLDSMGCAMGGLSIDKGKIAARIGKEMGGPPEATIIGTGDKVSIHAAAFANGETINALDMDHCTIPPGHVTPFVLPASLAVGEKCKVNGKNLIKSIAIGQEVSVRIGSALAYYRDVKPGKKVDFPPVHGYSSTIFGGTLGAGLLLGLDPKKLTNAMGIAGHIAPTQSMTKWTRTVPATTIKYLSGGSISQAEILAVGLAHHGAVGDVEVLEGDYGFWRYTGSPKWNPEGILTRLGEDWRFLGISIFKPYPTCRINHTVLDCFYHLVEKHQIKPEEIESITAYADPNCAVHPLWLSKNIKTSMDAQMSTPFAIATAAYGYTPGPEWQDLKTLKDTRIKAFMDKVTVLPHPMFEKALQEDSRSRIGKVEMTARGTVLSEERMYRKGSPATEETRMTDEELIQKFAINAERVLTSDKIDALSNMILHLDELDDVSCLGQIY